MTTYFAPQTDLQFTRFPSLTITKGTALSIPFASWVQQRRAAASVSWPTASDLCDELEQHRKDVAIADDDQEMLEHAEKLWKEATRQAKNSTLHVEVGAVLNNQQRADAHVLVITWLFVDIDGIERDRLSALVAKLRASGLCFYATESATSRLPLVATDKTGPYKVHTYVPIAPIVLPSGVPTVEIKAWWCKVYTAAVNGLLAGVVDKYDTSVDDLAQSCFVAQIPPGGDQRATAAVTDANYLDLEAYVASLGHNIPRPLPATATAPATATTQAVPTATATKATTAAAQTPRPVTASEGPTPGETTGSLVHMAISGLGLLGRLLDAKRGMWSCRCPWHTDHQTDPNQTVLDSSTAIFENGSVEGGFNCKHGGCKTANGGVERTAADVLSLARRRGVRMPDRAGWDGGGAEKSRDATDNTDAPKPASKQDPRLRIVVQDDRLADMAFATIASLTRRGDVYVKPTHSDDPHIGVIATITGKDWRVATRSHLTTIISQTARFVRVSVDKEGDFKDKPVEIPPSVVNSVLDMGEYPSLRPLRAVVVNPALLPSGRIVDQSGYDAESGLFYRPDAQITIPSSPSKADAEAAAKRLLDYVKHTQWTDERGPSVWLSLVLTIAGRAAIPTAPSFGFDAAVQKSGKTSLVKIAYGLMHGHTIVTQPPPPEKEEEVEKRLPQWATMSVVCFDNLAKMFASANLDQAITAARTGTRKLGVNAGLVCDFTSTTFAYTGNNLTVGDDAASRTLIARIRTPLTRKFDFAVDDAEFYKTQRPGAVTDALTILRAFIAAGSPQTDGPDCRFVEWSRLIRGAVKWLGMADPVGGEVVDTGAEVRDEALQALAAWRHSLGNVWAEFYAGELSVERFQAQDENADAYRIRRRVVDALSTVLYDDKKTIDKAALVGRALQKLRDAVIQTQSGSVRFAVTPPTSKNPKTQYRFVATA